VYEEDEKCIYDFSVTIRMKRQLGRLRFRLGNNIKTDLRVMTCDCVGLNWIRVAQNKAL
jgi:hypothetical protein